MALTSPPAAPQRGDRTTFANRVDAFITWLINLVSELNVFTANINTIAAGGAYAIPFQARTSASDVGGNGGILVVDGATQSTATRLVFDQVGSNNMLLQGAFDSVFGGTSPVKGYVRLVKQGDISKWLLFRVDSWVFHSGGTPYGELFGACVASSSANPLAYGDPIMMHVQRNGDKGDQGPAGTSNVVLLGSADVGSAVANIDFLNIFTSGYDRYEIEMHGVTASTATNVLLQFATGGSVDSATSYYPMTSGSGGALTGNTPVSSFSFGVISTGATSSMSAVIRVLGSTRVGHNKPVQVEGVANSSVMNLIGMYGGAAALSGFRLSPSAGNFTGGRIRVYGFKNS